MNKWNEKKAMTILEYISYWEGFKSKPYRCTAGKLTIGYGRNIEDRPLSAAEYRMLFPDMTISEAMKAISKQGISEQSAARLLKYDINNIGFQLRNESWFVELSRCRKIVIYDMCYNLGYNGLIGFRKMIKAIRSKDYEKASEEIMDSRYFKQVGRRAKANCYVMRLDAFPADLGL